MTVRPKSRMSPRRITMTTGRPTTIATATSSEAVAARYAPVAQTVVASAAPGAVAVGVMTSDGAAACDVCGHSLETHDRIADRFCRATLEHALARKCICPPPQAPHVR